MQKYFDNDRQFFVSVLVCPSKIHSDEILPHSLQTLTFLFNPRQPLSLLFFFLFSSFISKAKIFNRTARTISNKFLFERCQLNCLTFRRIFTANMPEYETLMLQNTSVYSVHYLASISRRLFLSFFLFRFSHSLSLIQFSVSVNRAHDLFCCRRHLLLECNGDANESGVMLFCMLSVDHTHVCTANNNIDDNSDWHQNTHTQLNENTADIFDSK